VTDTKIINADEGEFVDTYSDDLIYISEARDALLTHPLRVPIQKLADAAFCRMLAVFTVGNIEFALNYFRDRESRGILTTYFNDRSSNGKRVEDLYAAFSKAGVEVDYEVFADYLAIKYLRNTVEHHRWKAHEKAYVEERGFPGDTRKLSDEHWRRIERVNSSMMLYIALAGAVPAWMKLPDEQLAFPVNEATDYITARITTRDRLPRVFWTNLEAIDSLVGVAIDEAAEQPDYLWYKRPNAEAAKSWSEVRKLKCLAARQASLDGYDGLMKVAGLGDEAVFSWSSFWDLTFVSAGVTLDEIRHGRDALAHTCAKGNVADAIELESAMKLGRMAYEHVRNVTPAYLLNVLLPATYPSDTEVYLEKGEAALLAMEIGHFWYSLIEGSAPSAESFDLCREMAATYLKLGNS
jgi:hypothetical protein